jgi:hypothetical protein
VTDEGFRPTSDEGDAYWDLNDFFAVDVRLAGVEGRTVVTALHIYPRDRNNLPLSGLTARDLRGIRFDRIVDEYTEDFAPAEPSVVPDVVAEELESRRGRRRSPQFYAAIADLYLEALRAAPRRPVVHVADVLARSGLACTVNQVRSWVNLARQHGFLSEGVTGVAGARPTAALEESRDSMLAGLEESRDRLLKTMREITDRAAEDA